MKLLFLDIDGVLNHEEFYKERHDGVQNNVETYKELIKQYPLSEFSPKSISYINEVTNKTGAKIVFSSTWRLGRTLMELVELAELVGLTGEVIGKTPHLEYKDEGVGSVQRGVEIKSYLERLKYRNINWSKEEQQKYMTLSGIENFCIIDDDSDMLYNQRNHFIHVLPSPRNKSGFNEEYRDKTIEVLSKTVIELNYND